MTRPDFSEENIFQVARRIQPGEPRRAYLDQACGADAALRARIEALLRAFDESQSFLESPPAEIAPACPPTLGQPAERPGLQIGPYKLLQQIGEGGMGVVYMAEQEQPVRRRVALKIIKPGMDSRQVIARFEAERQALSLMDHPNIAKVLDAGTTESGRPYFVMELVKGQPITQYCDEHHLTPRQRLELLLPVCQAIQHAHQKGIIHRDIKPTNILVAEYDQQPVPKVIDFGVAKATSQALTERTMFTGLGQIVGTLEYMSPEQAKVNQLDIDTRSDIYSLGVLLYELLTGSTPFDKTRLRSAAFDEMLRIIREEEPPKPSTRLSDLSSPHAPREEPAGHGTRSVPATLASIAAVRSTEPAKLARLVRGELDWIVMKALEKDRNRRYESATGLAADIHHYLQDEQVAACPPSAMYRFHKFLRRNERALLAASLIGVAILFAVGSLGWVVRDRAAIRVRTAAEVGQFLQRAESLYADNKLPEAVAEVEKARGLLDAGRDDATLRREVRRWLDDLGTAAKLEEISHDVRDGAYLEYALVFREYGIDVESLPAEEAGRQIMASHIKLDLLLALSHWALRMNSDPLRKNAAQWQRLHAVVGAANADARLLRLLRADDAHDVQAIQALADETDLRLERPRILAFLGECLRAGDSQAAAAFLRKAQREHPGDFTVNATLGVCLMWSEPPQFDEAIGFLRAALAQRPNTFWVHCNLGICLKRQDKPEEAMSSYKKAIAIDPSDAPSHHNLAIVLRDLNRLDEALAEDRAAVAINPSSAENQRGLGDTLLEQNKLEEAVTAYRAAITINPKHVIAHDNLGVALARQDKLEEAIAEHRKAIRLRPDHASSHNNLGFALMRQDKLDEAIAEFRTAIGIQPDFAEAHNNLGTALKAPAQLDDAIAEYRTAISIRPEYATAHCNLGACLAKKGQLDDAIAAYREAIRFQSDYAAAFVNLGNALTRKRRYDDAVAALREGVRLKPNDAVFRNNLGWTLAEMGRVEEAIAQYEAAIRLQSDYIPALANLAWLLAAGPDPQCWDGPRAVELMNQVEALGGKTARSRRHLGLAHFRAGNWKESRAALEDAMSLTEGGDSYSWFCLAMTHQRLGDHDEARKWYDKAVEWMDKNQPRDDELLRFRAESARLLGIAVEPTPSSQEK